MTFLNRIGAGIRALFRKGHLEREMDDELHAYLDIAADSKSSAGLSREEAIRAARLEMGGVEPVKDKIRDVGWEWLVDSFWQDVRYAIKGLRKAPVFSTVAILTLALGIGANTAIFSVVNSLLLRALPVAEPQRLVTVASGRADQGLPDAWTYAIWDEIRERSQLFDGALAWSAQRFNLAQGGEIQPVDGVFASGDFFATLGVSPILGRTFTAADDQRGSRPGGPAAVISYALWQRRFGGAAGVVGSLLVVEGVPFTIVGVTPPQFFGAEVGRTFDVALPIGAEQLIHRKASLLDERRGYWLTVILRLRPGQSIDAATLTLRGVQPQIREGALPHDASPQSQQLFLREPFRLLPAAAGTSFLRSRYVRPLMTILAVVVVVLLIACANIANLLLARAAARQHEHSVRLALGAGRGRLARQLLVESLVLAGVGSIVGLLFAVWGARALVGQLSTTANPVFLDLSVDWRVLAFTAAVAIGTAVLFGTAPAFRATRAEPVDALKEHSRLGSTGRMTVSGGLVIAQVALSLILVVTAGLFVRTFVRLASVSLGFDSDRVLVVNVNATRARVDPTNGLPLYQQLVEAVAAVPGVGRVAASRLTPMSGQSTNFPVDVSGATAMSERDRSVRVHNITPGWLAAYGTPIRRGRDVDARDTNAAPQVVLVNEAFVRRFLPGQNAMGHTVTEPPRGRPSTPRAIVGIVGDAVYRSLRDEVEPTIYVPLAQSVPPGMGNFLMANFSLSIRSSSRSPVLLTRSVAAALTAVDPGVAFSFRPLEDQVNASLVQDRILAILSAFFGGLALLLAGLGLYGVTSYAVNRRQNEIGIRMALGARRVDVMRLVLGRSFAMTGAGVVLGLAGAAAVTRYVQTLLFALSPLDPATFAGVTLLFALVSIVAAFLPARRATTVDPMIALRAE